MCSTIQHEKEESKRGDIFAIPKGKFMLMESAKYSPQKMNESHFWQIFGSLQFNLNPIVEEREEAPS